MGFSLDMKVQNVSKQNFTGYSNIISHDSGDSVFRQLLLAVKLDNKDGHNDLDELRAFKRMYPMVKSDKDDDMLVMLYKRISPEEDCLFINNKPIFWGGELLNLEENAPHDDYKIIEKAHMKIYTLIASITKRIMKSKTPPVYKHVHGVINRCRQNFYEMFCDINASDEIIRRAVRDTFKHPETVKRNARNMNGIVAQTMNAFLKPGRY